MGTAVEFSLAYRVPVEIRFTATCLASNRITRCWLCLVHLPGYSGCCLAPAAELLSCWFSRVSGSFPLARLPEDWAGTRPRTSRGCEA